MAREDDRRLSRERERLKKERDQHIIRVKSLLALHGIAGYEPIRRAQSLFLPFSHDMTYRIRAIRSAQ